MPKALTISWWFFWTVFFSPSMPPTPTLLPPVAGLLTHPAPNVQAAASTKVISWRFIFWGLRRRGERVFNYDIAPLQQVPAGAPGRSRDNKKGALFAESALIGCFREAKSSLA